MASIQDQPTTPPEPVRGAPTQEDVLQCLVDRFGDQYQEPYEEGKRQFRDAIVDLFGIARDDAERTVDELEQNRSIRFHRQGVGGDVEVPRVGLFDTPETGTPDRTDREYAGRYWVIGRRDFVPEGSGSSL